MNEAATSRASSSTASRPWPWPWKISRRALGMSLIFSFKRSIRAKGSRSPLMKRIGQRIWGKCSVRSWSGKPGRCSGYEKRTRPPKSASTAAMLATRPPNDCPPPTTSCPRPEVLMKTGTARSAPPRGRSTAMASMPRCPMRHDRGRLASVELSDALLLQPLRRNLYLDARDADCTPHGLTFLACDVLVIFGEVERHRECAALKALHRTSHEKNSTDRLT